VSGRARARYPDQCCGVNGELEAAPTASEPRHAGLLMKKRGIWRVRRGRLLPVVICAAIALVGVEASQAAARRTAAAPVNHKRAPDSGPSVHHDKSPPLRSIHPLHTSGKAHPARPMPPGPSAVSTTPAGITNGSVSSRRLAPTPGTNFDGLTDSSPNTCACAPPDNEVAAGASQIVEIVNSELAVHSKTGAP
jgi:hypothetical protein